MLKIVHPNEETTGGDQNNGTARQLGVIVSMYPVIKTIVEEQETEKVVIRLVSNRPDPESLFGSFY